MIPENIQKIVDEWKKGKSIAVIEDGVIKFLAITEVDSLIESVLAEERKHIVPLARLCQDALCTVQGEHSHDGLKILFYP